MKEIYFTGDYLAKGVRIGIVAGMIALTVRKLRLLSSFKEYFTVFLSSHYNLLHFGYQEAIAIGRTFASMKDYQLDGNKEMVALGAMNVVGSMTSCYVATGKIEKVLKAYQIMQRKF